MSASATTLPPRNSETFFERKKLFCSSTEFCFCETDVPVRADTSPILEIGSLRTPPFSTAGASTAFQGILGLEAVFACEACLSTRHDCPAVSSEKTKKRPRESPQAYSPVGREENFTAHCARSRQRPKHRAGKSRRKSFSRARIWLCWSAGRFGRSL